MLMEDYGGVATRGRRPGGQPEPCHPTVSISFAKEESRGLGNTQILIVAFTEPWLDNWQG
jgi:hypothetical protein